MRRTWAMGSAVWLLFAISASSLGGPSAERLVEGPGAGWVWTASRAAGLEFSRSEVTVAQYRACVAAGVCSLPLAKDEDDHCNRGDSDRAQHPQNCVDFSQAAHFCAWAGGRLPTEAEWQAEASSAGSRKYPWGDEPPSCARTVMGESWVNKAGPGCGRDATWPVCSKPAGHSVSGLCDMAGNVWEWTSTLEGKGRVVRGGDWRHGDAITQRADRRSMLAPESLKSGRGGFRCVRELKR